MITSRMYAEALSSELMEGAIHITVSTGSEYVLTLAAASLLYSELGKAIAEAAHYLVTIERTNSKCL